MSRKTTFTALIVLLLFKLTSHLGEAVASDNDDDIVGSWRVVYTFTLPELDNETFVSLQTYHKGGTYTETNSDLFRFGNSPSHGVWESTESGFTVTAELLILDPTAGPDEDPLEFIAVMTQLAQLEDDGDLIRGTSEFKGVLLDGTVLFTQEFTLEGTRIGPRPIKGYDD